MVTDGCHTEGFDMLKACNVVAVIISYSYFSHCLTYGVLWKAGLISYLRRYQIFLISLSLISPPHSITAPALLMMRREQLQTLHLPPDRPPLSNQTPNWGIKVCKKEVENFPVFSVIVRSNLLNERLYIVTCSGINQCSMTDLIMKNAQND